MTATQKAQNRQIAAQGAGKNAAKELAALRRGCGVCAFLNKAQKT
jgi:hypothetical protein